MPGTAKPATTVVRAGRGGVKYADQIRFHAAKSPASARKHSTRSTCDPDDPAGLEHGVDVGEDEVGLHVEATVDHRERRRIDRRPARQEEQIADLDRVGDHRLVGAQRRAGTDRQMTEAHRSSISSAADLRAWSWRRRHTWSDHPINLAPLAPFPSFDPACLAPQRQHVTPLANSAPEHARHRSQARLIYPACMQDPQSKITLSPAPRRKLTETVAEQLLAAIRELPPGTKVPSERELTKELGVGRSTVREALNGLAMLGIVEIRHGQGVFVTGEPAQVSEPSAIAAALERGVTNEFIEARLIVEVEVARLAARRRTDEDLARLSAALDEQESRLRGDVDALVDVAASFNVLLAEAAHNEVLSAMIQSFVALMVERGPRVYRLDGFREWDIQEHRGPVRGRPRPRRRPRREADARAHRRARPTLPRRRRSVRSRVAIDTYLTAHSARAIAVGQDRIDTSVVVGVDLEVRESVVDVGVADAEVEADPGAPSEKMSSVAEITSTPLMNPLRTLPSMVASITSPSLTPYSGPVNRFSDVQLPIAPFQRTISA